MTTITEQLRPTAQLRLIDLVHKAGIDVSDWANFKGGQAKASVNPKYCYEWSFRGNGLTVLNLWHDELQLDADCVFQDKNFRQVAASSKGVRRTRASKMDRMLHDAFENSTPLKVVLLGRHKSKPSIVDARRLDDSYWHVHSYDSANGSCTIKRGGPPESSLLSEDEVASSFPEGEQRRCFVTHRRREADARKQKLEKYAADNGGQLICEVPGCNFNFSEKYGELGTGYAQVHHKTPLSSYPIKGAETKLDDLAVVCANCHVMIHLGGQCRPLEDLIP